MSKRSRRERERKGGCECGKRVREWRVYVYCEERRGERECVYTLCLTSMHTPDNALHNACICTCVTNILLFN